MNMSSVQLSHSQLNHAFLATIRAHRFPESQTQPPQRATILLPLTTKGEYFRPFCTLCESSDRTPFRLTMCFPRSYRATKAREEGIVVRTCADDVLNLGLTTIKTGFGNEVHAYDLERTLCDIVRGQRVVDVQMVNPAMKRYVHGSDKDVQKLLGYARAVGVEKKIRNYLEVLL